MANLINGEINGFCINEICLSNESNMWWVDNKQTKTPADGSVVDNFKKELAKIKFDKLVSENPEKLSLFGFNAASPVELKVNSLNLMLGSQNPSMDGTYLKISGENKVYETRADIPKSEVSTATFWTAKKVTEIPVLSITSIELSKGDKKVTIDKEDPIVPTLSAIGVVSYLNNFKDMTAAYTYKINTDDGEKDILLGVDKNDPKKYIYWVTTGNNIYYEIKKSDFDLLTAKIK